MGREHRALVLAPMRGPGFEALKGLADIVYEPFIEQKPLRLYNDEQLAERVRSEGATIVVCEGDRVGPHTLDLKPGVIGAPSDLAVGLSCIASSVAAARTAAPRLSFWSRSCCSTVES